MQHVQQIPSFFFTARESAINLVVMEGCNLRRCSTLFLFLRMLILGGLLFSRGVLSLFTEEPKSVLDAERDSHVSFTCARGCNDNHGPISWRIVQPDGAIKRIGPMIRDTVGFYSQLSSEEFCEEGRSGRVASTLTVEASEETQGLTLQCTFLCSTGECMRVQDFGLPFYSTVAILQLAEEATEEPTTPEPIAGLGRTEATTVIPTSTTAKTTSEPTDSPHTEQPFSSTPEIHTETASIPTETMTLKPNPMQRGSLLLEQFKIGFPVGVVVGLIIGVLLTGLISFCCCWRKYSQLRRETETEQKEVSPVSEAGTLSSLSYVQSSRCSSRNTHVRDHLDIV